MYIQLSVTILAQALLSNTTFSTQLCFPYATFAVVMDRPAKLQKLNHFRRKLPHISANALAAVVQAIKDEGPPELGHDRCNMRKARDEQCKSHGPFGPILQHCKVISKTGVEMNIPIAHPFALLHASMLASPSLQTLFGKKLVEHQCSPEHPWNLIIYSDEVTPGNVLSTHNKRKFQAVYFSLLELGQAALSHEECWWCIMVEMSLVVNTVAATMSQVFGALIKKFFDKSGWDLSTSGVLLPGCDGSRHRLFAKLGFFLQDGAAHKATWHSRGEAGSKFCLLCKNLFTECSKIVDADGTNLLKCNVIKKCDLEPAGPRDLRHAARYLARKSSTVSAPEFIELQQALGLTHQEHSILLDRTLDSIVDPVGHYLHDWMHCLMVDGVCNVNVYLLLEQFIRAGHRDVYYQLSSYLELWQYPGRVYAAQLPEIFSESRKKKHREAMHIKCQASDMLSLMPVLAMFCSQVLLPLGLDNSACMAFLAMADVVEFLWCSGRRPLDAAKLDAMVEKFLDLYVATYGCEWLTPKFHWLLHFGDHYRKHQLLPNCFVLERRHRVPKRYAEDLKNISRASSESLIMEVTCHHLALLSNPSSCNFDVGLLSKRPASKKVRGMLLEWLELEFDADIDVSLNARFSLYGLCKRNDVVLIKADDNSYLAGKLLLLASVLGVDMIMVETWTLKSSNLAAGYSKWSPKDAFKMLAPLDDILDTVTHTAINGDNVVTVLHPPDFR